MEKVTISSIDIGAREIEYVNDALKNEMLSAGKYLDEFESEFSRYYNKKHGIMVNSGQSAIEVAVEFCIDRLGRNIAVAVPALTYMATIWGALRIGTDLAFYDIKLSDYGISDNCGYSIDGDELHINQCDVVVPVDLFGKKCDFKRQFSQQIIIEDACESTGNTSCSYGDFICFSFYASHIMSAGGGGIVLLDDPEAEEFIRGYIAHGRTHSGDFTKRTDKFMDRFVFTHYGQSLRSDNLHAAIALAQYEKIGELVGRRLYVATRISDNLKELNKVSLLPDFRDNVFMFYPIVFDKVDVHALELMEYLYNNNIDSRRFMPVVTQPVFKKEFDLDPALFPNALMCSEKGILLGCHPKMTNDQIDYMCDHILTFFKNRGDI
jgi:dTDP-4-amino-4,6-dideoxygalactose transaminase